MDGRIIASVIINNESDFFTKIDRPNTTYIIKADVDLHGNCVLLPEAVTLIFKCESIKNGTLQVQSKTKLYGNNVTFKSHPHKQMIVVKNADAVVIDGFIFDTIGNKHSSYESGGVFISHCENIKVSNCSFFGDPDGQSGFVGLATLKVNALKLCYNHFKNFYKPDYWNSKQQNVAWATYLVSISNADIFRNYFDKTYSGIKLTGFIENVTIQRNIVENSITDGCDFAGISAKDVKIINNDFLNCGDCGVEFKILFLEAAHIDEMERFYGHSKADKRYFQDIIISNNNIESWVGLKIWNQYNNPDYVADQAKFMNYKYSSGNILLSGNTLRKTDRGSGSPHSDVGIQIAYNSINDNDFVVSKNFINGHKFGVYFVNSSKILIKNNTINSIDDSFYERFEQHKDLCQKSNSDIELYENKVFSQKGSALNMSSKTTNWKIRKNILKSNNSESTIVNFGKDNHFTDNIVNKSK